MGTEVTVVARRATASRVAQALFAKWEAVLSRFQPDSELSLLNAAAGAPFRASALLFAVVARSLEGARATGGLFDPTLLTDLERVGYDRTFVELRPLPSTAAPNGGGGWRRVRLDPRNRTIELPEDVGLDLGGIAKGLCVDATVDLLGRKGLEPVLVSAGGDLRVLGRPPSGAWPVSVGSGTLWLRAGALATSGRTGRRWLQDGVARHHLLDPRSGEPARSGLRSVSVAAGTCAHAEVATKAAFVLGPGAGADFLESSGLSGLFVRDDGTESRAGRWPAAAPATT